MMGSTGHLPRVMCYAVARTYNHPYIFRVLRAYLTWMPARARAVSCDRVALMGFISQCGEIVVRSWTSSVFALNCHVAPHARCLDRVLTSVALRATCIARMLEATYFRVCVCGIFY